MSVKYVPVQWSRFKLQYDLALGLAVALYLYVFIELGPGLLGHDPPIDGAIRNMRAFGSCAFFMLSAILMIGPLARLDARFLPLLYNRRHFGVMTCFVALAHFFFVFGWYFNYTPAPRYGALLGVNPDYGRLLGFPFESFGIFALLCLFALAATSHDFWLSFLSAPVWKALHHLIYPAYLAVVAHVALGAAQGFDNPTFPLVAAAFALVVAGLHVAAWAKGDDPRAAAADAAWERVCAAAEIPEGRARIGRLSTGERVAVFRHKGRLSAISNACAHQNGPLGEGRIIGGCVTCPWHGFQYRVADGRSPAPFTEKVPTYRLRLVDGFVEVDSRANPPGTYVEPVGAAP